MKHSNIVLLGLGVLIAIGVVAGVVKHYQKYEAERPVACTMEAMQCPDGSYVGRQGPKCEFEKCPMATPTPVTANTNSTGTALISKASIIGGVTITPIEVVSDSRCPSDVTCVWAGNISVRVKTAVGTTTLSTILSINTHTIVKGKKITLVGVSPVKISTTTLKPADYRFTFSVIDAK